MARYRLVIFDLDGTLVDSRQDLTVAVNHTLRRLDLPTRPAAQLLSYVGHGVDYLLSSALGPDHQDRFSTAQALFRAYYGTHLLAATVPYPGVPQMVRRLREVGATLAVDTNKPHRFSVAILQGLGLAEYFPVVIGGDSTSRRKPDPQGVDRILQQTGLAPEQTLFVGDMAVDLRTARAAGVAAGLVTWGLEAEEELAALHPDYLFRSAPQITELLAP